MKRLFTFFIFLIALSIFTVSISATEVSEDFVAEEAGESVFDVFYSTAREHAMEILCAISVLLTGALTLAYKKGLIPLITGSLSAMVGTVGKMKDATEGEADMLKLESEKISKTLESATDIINGFSERLLKLEEGLQAISKIETNENAIKVIMRHQVDTLADIFMNSALPEYQKCALAERLKGMKEELENVGSESALEQV